MIRPADEAPRPMIGPSGNDAPLLSVICPVYNADPEQLRAAIASVRATSPHGSVEVILGDDASTAAPTLAALAALEREDARLRVVRLPTNGGPGAARLACAKAARGAWLSFIDADDLWLTDRLSLLREALLQDPTAVWIAGRYVLCQGAVELRTQPPLSASLPPARVLGHGFSVLAGPPLQRQLIVNHTLHLGATLVRREAFLAAQGLAVEIPIGEDTYLQARLSLSHSLLYSSNVIYQQNEHPRRTTRSLRYLTHGDVPLYRGMQRDAAFAAYRREVRWSLYAAQKERALNNLLSGSPFRACRSAAAALVIDPRELVDAFRFLGMLLVPPLRRRAWFLAYAHARDLRMSDGRLYAHDG